MAEVMLEKASQKAKDLFNKGFAAFERGNLDYAIDLLFACVELEPGLLKARKFLRAAEVQKYKQKKRNSLSHSLSFLAGSPKYLNAMKMVKSGKPLEGLVAAEKLLREDPLSTKFVKLFAQAAANAGFPEAAIQTLEIARDHYQEDISIINWLGNLYQKIGRTKSARECFEKLCEICPNDPSALKSLKDAMALDSMAADGWQEAAEKGGSYRDMIKDAEEAVRLEQESKAVKSDKDVDSLIAATIAQIEAEPENINYYRALARLYSQRRMFDEAVNILRKARKLNPGDPELDNAVSSVEVQKFEHEIAQLKAAGDLKAAEKKDLEKRQFVFDDLQAKVQRYPNDLDLRYQLGAMLFENDYVNEAIQQFQLSQKNPKHRVMSFYYLAMCFKAKQQHDLALEQLLKAASEIPTMDERKKDIYYQLGLISEAMGDKQKAAEYYKQVYQVDIGYKDIAAKVEQVYKS